MTRPLIVAFCCVAANACRNFDEPTATLVVSPPAFEFTTSPTGAGPPARPLIVDRLGAGRLLWHATADVAWLKITPAQDTAPFVAWVTVVPQTLAVGTYQGRITITAGADSSVVTVFLEVRSTPTLSGRWVFTGDTINVLMTLTDSSGVVTGSGNFNSSGGTRRFFTVQGTAQLPSVTLTLQQTSGTTVTLTGSLRPANANELDAVLNGGAFSGAGLTLFRQ